MTDAETDQHTPTSDVGGQRSDNKNNADESKKLILRSILYVMGFGIICICGFGLVNNSISLALVQTMLAVSSTLCGALIGFLFGLPKTLQPDDNGRSGKSAGLSSSSGDVDYRFNTNLEQISDWLTKILVGVGLTQLTQIPPLLQSIGFYAVKDFNVAGAYPMAVALAIVFFIGGFLVAFLWTRLEYAGMQAISDKWVKQLIAQQVEPMKRKIHRVIAPTVGFGRPRKTVNMDQVKKLTHVSFTSGRAEEATEIYSLPKITEEDDPQKGRFGGGASNNGRKLRANVQQSPDDEDWFVLSLTVQAESGAPPLNGYVDFYLHNTFQRERERVPAKEGKAVLELLSYGAFTVGALADNGMTPLELDLSTLGEAPKKFRES